MILRLNQMVVKQALCHIWGITKILYVRESQLKATIGAKRLCSITRPFQMLLIPFLRAVLYPAAFSGQPPSFNLQKKREVIHHSVFVRTYFLWILLP